jgi:putative AlgH/UPF0301 family transcriptional regulator
VQTRRGGFVLHESMTWPGGRFVVNHEHSWRTGVLTSRMCSRESAVLVPEPRKVLLGYSILGWSAGSEISDNSWLTAGHRC